MKTWDDYKRHVATVDPDRSEDVVEMEELASIIGAIINRRSAMGISQRDLAALCHLPQSSVARMESMKSKPNLSTLLKVMKPLGLKLQVSSV